MQEVLAFDSKRDRMLTFLPWLKLGGDPFFDHASDDPGTDLIQRPLEGNESLPA